MPTTYQYDTSYNTMDLSGSTYSSTLYAFQGTGGYNITQQFNTIQRLPEAQINIFDTTGSVQVVIPVGVLNAKLGIIKTARNVSGGFLLDTVDSCGNYYDPSNNVLTTDSVSISANEFKINIPSAASIISVGKLSTIYSDFANYVASYFNLANPTSNSSGYATLFVNDYGFNPNGGVFDASALYQIIKGNGVIDPSNHSGISTLGGSINISNITKLLRYAVDANPFGNRDPSNGTTAIDPSNAANYGVSDGFLAGDIIFVPNNGFAMQLNANINYQTTINNYIQNNPNQSPVIGYLDTSLNGLANFHTTSSNTSSYIGRQMSTPLLIRLVDTAVAVAQSMPTQDISAGSTTLNLVSYAGLSIGMTIVVGTGANAETRTVVGFGSVILDRPLTKSFTAAETVVTAYKPKKLLTSVGAVGSVTSSTCAVNLTFPGKQAKVNIYRNGGVIASNITGDSYTDNGVVYSKDYTYSIVPYDATGAEGTAMTTSITTPYWAVVTSFSAPTETTSSISLAFDGSYSYVSLSRNGVLMNGNITGKTYVDSNNIGVDQSYNYTLVAYNDNGAACATTSLVACSSALLSGPVTTSAVTGSSVTLNFSGSYAYVNITATTGGTTTTLATNVTGTTYTVTGLSDSTSYSFNVIPYNYTGHAGTSASASASTTALYLMKVTDGTVDASWSSGVTQTLSANSTLSSDPNGCWNIVGNPFISLSSKGISSLLNKTITFDVLTPATFMILFGGTSRSNGCALFDYSEAQGWGYPYMGPNTTNGDFMFFNLPGPGPYQSSAITAWHVNSWVTIKIMIDSTGKVVWGKNNSLFHTANLSSYITGTGIGFTVGWSAYSYYIDNFKINNGVTYPTFTRLYSVVDGTTTGWVDNISKSTTTYSSLFYTYTTSNGSWAFSAQASCTTLATSNNITSFLNKSIEFDFYSDAPQNGFFFGGTTVNNGVSVSLASDQIWSGICPVINGNYGANFVSSPGSGAMLPAGMWIRVSITITSSGVVSLFVNGVQSSTIPSINMSSYLTGSLIGFITRGGCYVDNFTIYDGVIM